MLYAMSVPVDDDRGFFGHPRGLSTLFFTEMWERFSYYGMRAFLILYMVTPVAGGGLGFSDPDAASIYGTYTGSVWGAAILGGIVADRFLGQYRSVLVGGIIIALGHFALAFKALPFFYSGLTLIVVGTGLLKPNVSTVVGSLYAPGDTRRDAGFSIFYMGINLGAFLGPLVAGYLAQRVDWHLGFACAGVGMALGVVQYIAGRKRLLPAIERMAAQPKEPVPRNVPAGPVAAPSAGVLGFSSVEWKRIGAIVILFIVASLFWGGYEQAGSTLTLFADRYTRLEIMGFSFPSSWFQTVQPICVILFAPLFAWLWIRLGSREPSVPTKFALALMFMSVSFLVLVPAGAMAQDRRGRSRQSDVARGRLRDLRARRTVSEPRWPQRGEQARTRPHPRADDGRLVPVEQSRQQARGLGRGLHQHHAARDALQRRRGHTRGQRQ